MSLRRINRRERQQPGLITLAAAGLPVPRALTHRLYQVSRLLNLQQICSKVLSRNGCGYACRSTRPLDRRCTIYAIVIVVSIATARYRLVAVS